MSHLFMGKGNDKASKKKNRTSKKKGSAPKRAAPRTRAALSKAEQLAAQRKDMRVREAEGSLAYMTRLKQTIADAFYDLALELKKFRDKKMHLILGYRTFNECMEDREVIGRDAAQKLLAIVDAGVSREVALQYGSHERAYAALKLTRRTKREDDSPATLLREEKKIGGAPADSAPIREYAEAMRAIDEREQTEPRKLSPEQRAINAVVRDVRKLLSALPGVDADVRAKSGREPRVFVELTMESARALVERLAPDR